MKKIKSIQQLESVLEQKQDIYREINGQKYVFHFVRVLQTTLIDLMGMIKDESLFYNPEY